MKHFQNCITSFRWVIVHEYTGQLFTCHNQCNNLIRKCITEKQCLGSWELWSYYWILHLEQVLNKNPQLKYLDLPAGHSKHSEKDMLASEYFPCKKVILRTILPSIRTPYWSRTNKLKLADRNRFTSEFLSYDEFASLSSIGEAFKAASGKPVKILPNLSTGNTLLRANIWRICS
jgi:hypothetical protein